MRKLSGASPSLSRSKTKSKVGGTTVEGEARAHPEPKVEPHIGTTTMAMMHPCDFNAELRYPRFKIVVQTVIGQNKAQGARVASRCLWDTDTDNYSSFEYKNVSDACSSMVRHVKPRAQAVLDTMR
jgi:hypothetical protein